MAFKEAEQVQPISELYHDFSSGKILPAPWQRGGRAWDAVKHNAFHGTLQEIIKAQESIRRTRFAHLEMPFYIYCTSDTNTEYLNDGQNRLESIKKFLQSDLFSDDIKDGLKLINVQIQKWIYKDDTEAAQRYFLINNGTNFTPLELAKITLHTELPNFKRDFEPRLESFATFMNLISARMGCKRNKNIERSSSHKHLRDNYAIIVRCLTEDKTTSSFDAARGKLPNKTTVDEILKHSVEKKLILAIKDKYTANTFSEAIEKLQSKIERFCAIHESLYTKIFSDKKMAINISYIRWLIHAWIYFDNNSIPIIIRDDFMTKFMENAKGASQVMQIIDANTWKRKPLYLSELNALPNVCEKIGFDFSLISKNNRPKKRNKLPNGYDNSHFVSWIEDPGGETFPEPASRNRARGSAPVPVELRQTL